MQALMRSVLHRNRIRQRSWRYQEWISKYDTITGPQREELIDAVERMAHKPLISIIMPVYNIEEKWLRQALDSVLAQIYPNWELCIADDNSPEPGVRAVIEEYAAREGRVKAVFRKENGHISRASNSALELAGGEYTALMDHDDLLAEHALYYVAAEINVWPDAALIYSDEDKTDESGRRYQPNFKPDWSPDFLHSINYIGHLAVYRTSILREIGGFRAGFEGSQDHDLLLRYVEKIRPDQVRHIPRVLYHWRAISGSVANYSGEKPYAHLSASRALNEHFTRTGIKARSVRGVGELHRAVYELPDPRPRVSLILGPRWQVKRLNDLIEKTDYGPIEAIMLEAEGAPDAPPGASIRFIDGGTDEPVFGFFERAADAASGSVLCFLRDRIVPDDVGWLTELVSRAIQDGAGAVGARVLYPNFRIRHAGLILGIRASIGRAHNGFRRFEYGVNERLALPHNVSAVSADCLAVSRAAYSVAGGLDTELLPRSYADIDLGLKLAASGLRNVVTPWADVIQPLDHAIDDQAELDLLKEKWPGYFENDPYYNPNLTIDSEDLDLAFPPRLRPDSITVQRPRTAAVSES